MTRAWTSTKQLVWKLRAIQQLVMLRGIQHPLATAQLAFVLTGLLARGVLRTRGSSEQMVRLGEDLDFWVRDFSEVLVLRQIFVSEIYAHPALPADAHCIVDLGCNIGASMVWLSRRYPDATIIGVEANPLTCELARRNTERYEWMTVENVAVSDTTGTVSIRQPLNQSWAASIYAHEGDPVMVPSVSLDDLLAQHALDHVDLLKIDVEGAEHATLGATRRLRDVSVIVGEFHEQPDHDWRTFEEMLGGFQVEQLHAMPNEGLADFIAVQRRPADH
jgi:FkbM family methyltransferase